MSRLNLRIGHIVSAKKHPDADGLYVEEVDLGEGRCRTIVSGLVKHVPLEKVGRIYLHDLFPFLYSSTMKIKLLVWLVADI